MQPQFFLVLEDLPVELVGQRVDGRVHVGVDCFDMHVASRDVHEMRHRIVGHWERADCSTVETRVRYVDRFGRTFEFPGCTLLFFESELAREVRIFVDNHAMFIPPGVSVGNN